MDGLKEAPGSRTTILTRQPTVRLVPAAILQPRLRLVDGDTLIKGPAFDLHNIVEEDASPPRNASTSPRTVSSPSASSTPSKPRRSSSTASTRTARKTASTTPA